MTSKTAFIQHWKRIQALLAVFVAINFGAFFIRPDWLPLLWAVFMPVSLVLLWRLRCWNCQQRLLKDGAAHIEWRGSKMAHHKTCGAELS